MNLMLGDLADVCVLVYLDSILFYLATAKDYTRYVRAAFERLANLEFYLKYKKCALLLPDVEFLGHVVSECGVSVLPGKNSTCSISLFYY